MENQNGYISVHHLRKKYTRKKQEDLLVFDDISFNINKGEFLCIVGESGCGKSTLLRLISGLDTEYEGQIIINHKSVKSPDKSRGFVYQESRLFPWMTVEKNVGFVINDGNKDEKRKKIKEILEIVGLKGFETAYPKELSGGMAQRVNIARALVNKPDVLFFDEPFGALDALTRMQLQKELLMIHRKHMATTLLVTHDIEEAIYLANKIIVLKYRPAKIMDFIEIKLPYIRDRGNEDFQAIRKSIYKYFQDN
ncbi:aliphatic sulfonates import ATP-binding protein SsuB [Lachnospiraceae bacterium]|nr:aliphatic sulfonates import ATP-binding protein SsuB [Lachnospiraceae bacterium]